MYAIEVSIHPLISSLDHFGIVSARDMRVVLWHNSCLSPGIIIHCSQGHILLQQLLHHTKLAVSEYVPLRHVLCSISLSLPDSLSVSANVQVPRSKLTHAVLRTPL